MELIITLLEKPLIPNLDFPLDFQILNLKKPDFYLFQDLTFFIWNDIVKKQFFWHCYTKSLAGNAWNYRPQISVSAIY